MLQIRTILVPTDYSDYAEHALAHAAYLADRYGADLHVLHVRVPNAPLMEGLTGLRVTPEEVCEQLHIPHETCTQSHGRGEVVEVEVAMPSAVEGILDYAAEHAADLVVMGSRGRTGLRRLVEGSVAERVVRRAACPVLTVGSEAEVARPARRVLVPTDFSEFAREAVAVGAEAAAAYGAELHVLHVARPSVMPPVVPSSYAGEPASAPVTEHSPDIERSREALARMAQDAAAAGVPTHAEVRVGDPVPTILDYAGEAEAGLLVLASHGRTGLRRLLLGSVAERVVREAPCPTLVVKAFGKSLLPQDAAEEEPLATARVAPL
jgi:nucleotide-binding universal stress UspA family protein